MKETSHGSSQRFERSHELLFSKPVKVAAEGEDKRTFQMGNLGFNRLTPVPTTCKFGKLL